VRFGLFDDGLFITAARPEYQALIGNKVLELDDTTVDAALETTKLVSFFENDSRARLMAPDRLALPDVNRVLGITESSDVMFATTADSDGQLSVTELATLNEPGLAFVDGAAEKKPLWLSRTDEYRWYTVLDDTDAIYVQVNQFEENPAKPYGDFVAESMAAARAAGVSRFVIDLRHNSGGIGAWVTPFVIGLGRSEFNKYGQLFILVGRTTFSAAQTFMHKFEELTYAMFVGEPSGAKPSHFSDPRRIVLDNSGLTLRISTIYWHSWLANDFRDAIEPHISAPISAADYFNGTDPALQAALSYRAPRTLALQIDEQFRQGKNQNAILLFQRFMNDTTVQDHSQAIPDLLDTADRLVDDGFVRPGYFIYLLARMSYPEIAAISPGLARIEALMN
ncbi:MAG: S41 family peptidase, partial [Gammaproteobacteria bacterium]|nr:S41 family peptidase [Gammaproteobacteria bacterium]